MRGTRGSLLVETLLAAAIGVLVLGALTGALAAGARALVRAGARSEANDTANLATEAFVFDVRRAGYDEAAAGIAALGEARSDRLVLHADLDGDGAIDPNSAERVGWICNVAARRLSRTTGAQSLPLAGNVARCGLSYFDAVLAPLPVPAGGLDATTRAQVAVIALDLRLVPRGGGPPVDRLLAMALRSQP
jgi:hypothetical protein